MQTLLHTEFLIQQTSGIWEGFLGVRALGLEELFCLLPVEISGSLVRSCGQYRSTASFFSHQILAGFTHVQLCLMRAGTFPLTPCTSPEGSTPCVASPWQGTVLQRLHTEKRSRSCLDGWCRPPPAPALMRPSSPCRRPST